MPEQSSDPVVVALRERISENDLAILDALNRRLALVRELHAHKRRAGYPTFDGGRESSVADAVAGHNRGPLSEDAVRELWPGLIALTTREAARLLDAGETT